MDQPHNLSYDYWDWTRYQQKRSAFCNTRTLRCKALEAFGDLGEDEELGPADWPTVKRYIKILNDIDGESIPPRDASEHRGNVDGPMDLKDIRVRILNGVQAAYWTMLDEGRLTHTTANILMQSVDEALDLVAHEPLCDWKGLKDNVHFPNYYRFLKSRILPQNIVMYFTVGRLESACSICAAFLRAHRIARQQLHDFIGDSEIACAVINESEAEGEEARNFLEDVRITFPQVLQVVKTRQVITHSVLKHLIDYIGSLEKAGLLEQKEMLHLHETVQADLKRLSRNPPLVKIPKVGDLITTHPFLGALPEAARNLLVGSTKETMKVRGVPLYKEGSRPNGIWLISNGVVKGASKSRISQHALHPTFIHGSTLGLSEVLIGKSYICDMITDSVVVCFFIEAEKIRLAQESDPVVEDFLWKESVIVLAKILLPQLFEKMTMQDLRALVAERSTMKTHQNGETIDVPALSVGILLDGYIKGHTLASELITAPAALWPAKGNASFFSHDGSGYKSSSFSHLGLSCLVEARARVIILDITALQAERTLSSRKSSSLLHDGSRSSLEVGHGSLLSWPEHYCRQHRQDNGNSDLHGNNLSATAMQLSISMRALPLRAHSFGGDSRGRSNNRSYRKAPDTGWPLVSTRSEGPGLVMKKDTEIITRELPARPKHDSSDDSEGEDEIIVTIDSPSRLSFRKAL